MIKKYRVLLGGLCLAVTSLAAENRLPNVVIIYGDDVGYADVGVYGSEKIPTPNIDQLAKEGIQFLDGHCTAATCTPSRFSMLTGLYGFRRGVGILPPDAPLCIPTDILTLPKLFKQAGYDTAVIGKWHLGLGKQGVKTNWNGAVQPGPLEIGFDYSFLLPSTNDRVPCVYLENHHVVNLDPNDPLYVTHGPVPPKGFTGTVYPDGVKKPAAMTYYPSSHGHNNSVINGIGRIGYQWGGKSALWNDETMADEFVDRAQQYIASRKKDTPFFLYFASQDIHVPRAPHPRFQGTTSLGKRGDAMVQFDWVTGEIVKALEAHGLRDNTIIIFSSDNGPVYDDGYKDGSTVYQSSHEGEFGHDASGPYRGGKYQIYEGGTRVPFIISWPEKIKPGTSNALVSQIDFMASFADLIGVKLADDEAVDSRTILSALMGEDEKGLPYTVEEAWHTLALRRGPWKYVSKHNEELYNLDSDIGETNNVIGQYPEVAKQMRTILTRIKTEGRIRKIEDGIERPIYSASSAENHNPVRHAFDGNEATRWAGINRQAGHWLQVDYKKTTSVSGVQIVWEHSDKKYGYIVEGSDDATSWEKLAAGYANTQGSKHPFTAKKRYYRVRTTTEGPDIWPSIREFILLSTTD